MTFFEVSFVVFEFPEKAFMTRVFVVGVVQHLLLEVLELLLLPFKIEDGLVCLFLVHSDFGWEPLSFSGGLDRALFLLIQLRSYLSVLSLSSLSFELQHLANAMILRILVHNGSFQPWNFVNQLFIFASLFVHLLLQSRLIVLCLVKSSLLIFFFLIESLFTFFQVKDGPLSASIVLFFQFLLLF